MSAADPPGEIRVHGVGGPQAPKMLGEPFEHDVMTLPPFAPPDPGWNEGDPLVPSTAETRFVRRADDDGTEAYEWGGLTTGSLAKALWVLYLPFTMINAAGWAHPLVDTDANHCDRGRLTARVHIVAVHIAALLATATYVLWIAYLTLDLVAVRWRAHVLSTAGGHKVEVAGIAGDAVRAWVPVLTPTIFLFAIALIVFAPVLRGRWEEVGGGTDGGWELQPRLAARSFFSKAGTYRRRQRWHVLVAMGAGVWAVAQYACRWNRIGLAIVAITAAQVATISVLALAEIVGRARSRPEGALAGYDGGADGTACAWPWLPIGASMATLGSALTHAAFTGVGILARRFLANFPEKDKPNVLAVRAELGSADIMAWIVVLIVVAVVLVAMLARPLSNEAGLVVRLARRARALGAAVFVAIVIPVAVYIGLNVRGMHLDGDVTQWWTKFVAWYDGFTVKPSLFQYLGSAVLVALPPVLYGVLVRPHDSGPARVIGNIWDVLTFWPRRFHPLAAPTSAERSVPELRSRIEYTWSLGTTTVLVAHSQGSVLAAAALASARPVGACGSAYLVTFGSPLGTLYAPVWPAYIPKLLVDTKARVPSHPGWVNFWRPTDPIGAGVPEANNAQLPDPQEPTIFELDQARWQSPLERPGRWGTTAGHGLYLTTLPVRHAITSRRSYAARGCPPCAGTSPCAPADAVRWAHQGGLLERPSNTVAAFTHALTEQVAGAPIATALELDVHVTADNELVVIHDRTTQRTTNGQYRVRKQTLETLQTLDAGYSWGDPPGTYRDPEGNTEPCRIPTLDEVLDLLPNGRVRATIEAKRLSAVRRLIAVLATHPATAGRFDTITLVAFDPRSIRRMKREFRARDIQNASLAPGVGYMLTFILRVKLGMTPKKCGYDRIQIPVNMLGITFATERVVKQAHAVGLKVDLWTVNDRPTMEWALCELGVDGIMTDAPTLLARVVAGLEADA